MEAGRSLDVVPSPIVTEQDSNHYVSLRFDVTRPLRELVEDARRQLKHGKKNYERVSGKRTEKRRRLDQYRLYLQVWDLRQQVVTFDQIAQRVFPVEYEGQLQNKTRAYLPVVQKVKDAFSRARQLIEGGYKELA